MKLQPRYCRTCGTRILVKNVCHNCGSDPLTGDNYCYDCGSLTPESVKCSNCGASFQKKIASSSAIIVASVLILIIAVAAYIVSHSDKEPAKTEIVRNEKPILAAPDTAKQKLSENEAVTISNTIPAENIPKKQDSITAAPIAVAKDTTTAKPAAKDITTVKPVAKDITSVKPVAKDISTAKPAAKDTSAAQKMAVNLFSSAEIGEYKPECTYFVNKQKNQVLLVTSNESGYIKMNEKVYPLKRTQKGSNVLKFSGDLFEVIIQIKGLTGSDKEWLASGIVTVKDQVKKTVETRKIYSTCL